MQNDFFKALQNMGAQLFGQSAGGNASWADGMEQYAKLFGGTNGKTDQLFDQVMNQGKAYVGMLEKLYQAGSDGSQVDFAALAKQWLDELTKANPFMQLPNVQGAGTPNFGAFAVDPSLFNAQHFLNMPAFGFARESQERQTDLIKHMQAYGEAMQGYQALQNKSMQMAVDRMQSKLEERNEPGRELDSLKAVYDLWIDALEESFAEVALSAEYQAAYGKLVDAQMRVRANVQKQIELSTGQFGIPTRTELEGVHQKLAEVRRSMRAEIAELRAEIESLRGGKRTEKADVATTKAASAPSLKTIQNKASSLAKKVMVAAPQALVNRLVKASSVKAQTTKSSTSKPAAVKKTAVKKPATKKSAKK